MLQAFQPAAGWNKPRLLLLLPSVLPLLLSAPPHLFDWQQA